MSKRNSKLTKRQMVRIIHAHELVVYRGRRWSFIHLWFHYELMSKAQLKKHLPAYPARRQR